MSVKLATQVMSNSVACAIELLLKFKNLPSEAEGTAKIVSLFEKLFDCTLNASLYNHPNKYKNVYTGSEEQKLFFNETFARVKLIDRSKPEITNTCSLFIIEEVDKLNFKSKQLRTITLIEKYISHYKKVVSGSEEYYNFINEVQCFLMEIRVLKNNKSKTDLTSKVDVCHGSSSIHDKFIILYKCSPPRSIKILYLKSTGS